MSRQFAVRVAIAFVAVLAVGTVAFRAGSASGGDAEWRTGTARVLGVPLGLVDWIDGNGTSHTGDRLPGCLAPVPSSDPRYGEGSIVRFATVDADVSGLGGTRLVAAVDCRPPG